MICNSITLVGRAHSLAFDNGTATWRMNVRPCREGGLSYEFALQSRQAHVLEQFEAMDDGMLIGVIATQPPVRQRKPGAALTVTRLEILGKALATVEG